MDQPLLAAMLATRPEMKGEGDFWSVAEDGNTFALLLASAAGPVPLGKLRHMTLGEGFVTAESAEATWCLPYSALLGLRLESSAHTGRPGFRR
ncbi:MAG: hypothetical protein R3F60_15300 [bacterium]